MQAAPPPFARVCGTCERGLLIEAPAELAPAPRDAFLIVDRALAVQSLSPAAAELLAVGVDAAAGRPVTELLVPADVEAGAGPRALALAIARAAVEPEPQRMTVRPRNVFGVRMPLRVGICGPPRAALLVLE